MNTYEGCNKEIADSLKKGIHIECRVKDGALDNWYKGSETIGMFIERSNSPYVQTNGISWRYAEPLPATETRVKNPAEIMRLLVDSLYEVDDTGHCWSNPNKITFMGDMWKDASWLFMGTRMARRGGDTPLDFRGVLIPYAR